MIKTLLVAARDRNRLKEIVHVASRFGLGVLLARLGLTGASQPDEADDPDSLPKRARLALEALGPTFVKLGQILATRGDLLPPEWIAELEQLHSRAPVLPFAELRPAVEAALGQSPETAFSHFDPEPLAAASIAQVHRATLADGRAVVLKIRRPGIRPQIEADLRLIAQLASVVEAANAAARRFAPAAMVRQLAEAVLDELDLTSEGRNADRLRADFAHDPRVIVPEIHWVWTSESLLVMDYVDGTPPRDGATLRAAGIDPDKIAALGAAIVLDMVLVNGRFHADPHTGNLLCLPGNRIALLDLGMIGHVSPRRREEFISFVHALHGGDAAALADILALWSAGSGVPPDRIQAAAECLIGKHGGGRIVLGALVADFLATMRVEAMTVPSDLLLVFKALITIDGVLMGINPGFDLSAAIRQSLVRIASARLSVRHWGPTVQALLWELAKVGDDAPRLLRAAIRRLEGDPPAASLARNRSAEFLPAGNRIAAAILVGAVLVAGAVLFAAA